MLLYELLGPAPICQHRRTGSPLLTFYFEMHLNVQQDIRHWTRCLEHPYNEI